MLIINVIMLSDFMLSAVMLSIIMLSAIMLNVVVARKMPSLLWESSKEEKKRFIPLTPRFIGMS
jgi:hypothetical protein